MGALGSSNNGEKATFISAAGGYFWDMKMKDKDHPKYQIQKYTNGKGEEKIRSGAQYDFIVGTIKKVAFSEHDQYGKSVRIFIENEGELVCLALSVNTKLSQDAMKFLLLADFDKAIYAKPYEFEQQGKVKRGISFQQGGVKVNLNDVEGLPWADAEIFKKNDKKKIKRFFEDLADWLENEITDTVIPVLKKKFPEGEVSESTSSEEEVEQEAEQEAEQEVEKTSEKKAPAKKSSEKKVSLVGMRKAIKAYVSENYEDQEMPKLSKDEVPVWYKIVMEEGELPFEEDEDEDFDDLDAEFEELDDEE